MFGELSVLRHAPEYEKYTTWVCACSCGKQKDVVGSYLTSGKTKSCGCKTKQLISEKNTHHSMVNTPEYRTWSNMLTRCRNPENKGYKDYGGRGITVDPTWLKFENFYRDMGERPEGTSLDRRDNNEGYSKENCKWSTKKEQARNRRSSALYTIGAETKTLAEWCEIQSIDYAMVFKRLKRGYSIEKAIERT